MEMARYGRSVGLGLYSRGWAILRSAAIDIRGVATLSGTTFTAPPSGHGVAVSGQFLSRSGRSAARMASRAGPCGGDRVHPAEPTEPDGDGVRRDAMSERRPVLIDRIVRALSPGLRVEERRERIDAFDARVGAEPGDRRRHVRQIEMHPEALRDIEHAGIPEHQPADLAPQDVRGARTGGPP